MGQVESVHEGLSVWVGTVGLFGKLPRKTRSPVQPPLPTQKVRDLSRSRDRTVSPGRSSCREGCVPRNTETELSTEDPGGVGMMS